MLRSQNTMVGRPRNKFYSATVIWHTQDGLVLIHHRLRRLGSHQPVLGMPKNCDAVKLVPRPPSQLGIDISRNLDIPGDGIFSGTVLSIHTALSTCSALSPGATLSPLLSSASFSSNELSCTSEKKTSQKRSSFVIATSYRVAWGGGWHPALYVLGDDF